MNKISEELGLIPKHRILNYNSGSLMIERGKSILLNKLFGEQCARVRILLCEELEILEYYQERINAVRDISDTKMFESNIEEVKDHIVMLITWIRENHSI